MKLSKNNVPIKASKQSITAADEDFVDDTEMQDAFDDTDGLSDQLDDLGDQLEDIQDDVDDVDEDEPTIEIDNNITNHFIAECDRCKGVFISAVIESDQEIDHISGICPLCSKETDQKLKWVIHDVDSNTKVI